MALFNRTKTEENAATNTQQLNDQPEEIAYDGSTRPRPEVREEDFIDTSDPNAPTQAAVAPTPNVERITRVEYTMGMPIDGVYIYMEKDWEGIGLKDASSSSDISYMESKVEIIKQGLQRRFDLAKMNYNKKIREAEAKINTLNQLGLAGTMSDLEAHIETCKEHLERLKELEDRFLKNDPSLLSMVQSYRSGFAIGVARATQNSINLNSSQL